MAVEPETSQTKDKVYKDVHLAQNSVGDHADRDQFPNMQGRNLMIGGAIVILGLLLGGLILGYNVVSTETQRGDAAPSSSSVPVRP